VKAPLRWLLALVGTMWPGHTPRELPPTFWGRKAQARACMQRVLAWQPRRVILAHGRGYDGDALAQLERAFAWLR
jgi:hypothetical protein